MAFYLPGDKFVFLGIQNTALADGLQLPIVLSPTLQVAAEFPEMPNGIWPAEIGRMRMERIGRCNLAILCREASDRPEILDHQTLRSQVFRLWHGILFTGIPYSENVHMMCGNVTAEGFQFRQIGNDEFKVNLELPRVEIDEAKLRRAFAVLQGLEAMAASQNFKRVKRGYRSLLEGIKGNYADHRLHYMVRAMDALIRTPAGAGRAVFVHKCNTTFLDGRPPHAEILGDIFDLRSWIEHQKEIEDFPERILDAAERRAARERLVRQVEVLVLAVYARLTLDAGVRAHFETDATSDAFWAKLDGDRRAAWNERYDLTAVQ